LVRRAARAFAAIAASPGMTTARRLHEVPFSLRRSDGAIVRGAIDAIIEHADGRIEVLEFKTGQRRDEHQQQLALYVEAARALFPGHRVEGRLVYVA
jgi:ATP-dependent exoDNAse (exonuclease V) beta subunit